MERITIYLIIHIRSSLVCSPIITSLPWLYFCTGRKANDLAQGKREEYDDSKGKENSNIVISGISSSNMQVAGASPELSSSMGVFRYPIQKVTEIYKKVTELYNKVTELKKSS